MTRFSDFFSRSIFIYFLVNLLMLCYGVSIGWSSPNLLILESDESPIGKITREEASWVASLQCFGGFFSNLFFGLIGARLGRKIPLILMAVPTIVTFVFCNFKEIPSIIMQIIIICPDCLVAGFIRTKCLLFVCIALSERNHRRCCVYNHSALLVRDFNRSVGIVTFFIVTHNLHQMVCRFIQFKIQIVT